MQTDQTERASLPSPLEEVHLVFKTHLDLGFTDFAREVIADYFSYFIPKALRTAEVLRRAERPDRFIWTTGAWLIYEYLEQAAPRERARMEEAILAGDVAWHAMPFTVHSELLDRSLFRAGLRLSQELDRRFGKQTIAAKMTDVPGHTRGIVPLLADAGVQLLHIGVNPVIPSPEVPPIFVWRAPSGEEIMVMYHHAYGGIATVPGGTDALALEMTGDNLGPLSLDAIRDTFRRLQANFPEARVKASTLDAFARRLCLVKATLPVVTDEIGDTWIHGVGSDPRKVSHYRELCRLRNTWLEAGRVHPDEHSFAAFSRALLLIPEHTWGMDEKKYLADEVHYSATDFATARHRPHFQQFEASWAEQRQYLDDAIHALETAESTAPLAQEATARLTALDTRRPDLSGFTRVDDPSRLFETTHFRVGFDPLSGALNCLEEHTSGRQWASPDHLLALFRYEMFSSEDYERFFRQYVEPDLMDWGVRRDLGKPGMEALGIVAASWVPRLSALYWRHDATGHQFLIEQTMPEEPATDYGSPAHVTMQIRFPDEEASVQMDLQWFEKPACRLPEALWFSFTPRISDVTGWSLDKLGQSLSPLEVVRNGNRNMHAVGTGLTYHDQTSQMIVETLDAPLVAPGERSLLNFTNDQPRLEKGMHFNLFNNVFGSNFCMWYDEDARFRFVLKVNSES